MIDQLNADKSSQPSRASFVLRYGVLAWGVTTGLVFALVTALAEGADANVPVTLALSLVLFPLGGIAWGRVMWWLGERTRR